MPAFLPDPHLHQGPEPLQRELASTDGDHRRRPVRQDITVQPPGPGPENHRPGERTSATSNEPANYDIIFPRTVLERNE